MNVLVITDHFTQYAGAIVTSNQSTRVMATAFWNECIANYSFPETLLMDQGYNFESQLIEELCKLAHIHKVWAMPDHPKTYGQCERFNQMLINMINTLESTDKQRWKYYLPTLVHAYNCTKNNAMDVSPYYLMYGCKPRLPINIKFGLMSHKTEEHLHYEFVAKLNKQLQKCYELANRHHCKVWPKDENL